MMQILQWSMENSVSLILGIIGIGFLIGIHEFGHFIMCKICGIYTPTFAIGFGPTLLSRTIGTTRFTLKSIPLGGYVEIAGLAEPGQGGQEEAEREDRHAFPSKPFYQKLLVALGGIIFNILFSIIVFAGILYVGAPQTRLLYPANASTSIERIADNGAELELQANDTITAINDKAITEGKEIYTTALAQPSDATLSVTYQRDGQTYTTSLPVEAVTTGKIRFTMLSLQASSLGNALYKGAMLTYGISAQVYYALSRLITKQQTQGLGGPVRIIAESVETARNGIGIFLLFLGFLSVNLAAINLLPIPVLDGGHIVYLCIEQLIGRPVPQYIRGYVDYAFAILLILGILTMSFFDIRQLLAKLYTG